MPLLFNVYALKLRATSQHTAMQLARTDRLKLIRCLQARSAYKPNLLHQNATIQASSEKHSS